MMDPSAGAAKGDCRHPAAAFIAVGSNLDPRENIPRALAALCDAMEVRATSTFYRTAPLRGREQPPFFNGVWRVATDAAPRAIKFGVLRPMEEKLGRKRTEDRYASRPIDLDLILCGDHVLDEPDLRIPDPDLFTRPFIAAPLLELAPDLVIPGGKDALADLEVAQNLQGLEPLAGFTAELRKIIEGR